MHPKLVAVIVTYNRKVLLQRCLKALLAQTTPLDRIFVVDNASTDGTTDILASDIYRNDPHIECQRLPNNVGGAGGFAAGMDRAYEWGADHIWIMDDDAAPDIDALTELLPYVTARAIPVSTQVDRRERLYGAYAGTTPSATVMPLTAGFGAAKSMAMTFVGPLLSRECIARCGLPRKDFFICVDDIEYSLRVRDAGFDIIIVERSQIFHEYARGDVEKRFLLWKRLRPTYPAWKCYYDMRNKIVTAKLYCNGRIWPIVWMVSLFLRKVIGDFTFDPQLALARTAYRLRGVVDGVTGRLGKRVLPR